MSSNRHFTQDRGIEGERMGRQPRSMTTDNRTAAQVDPSEIMRIGMGFWASKTLLSAVELELFTELGGGAMTAAEIAAALGLHERAAPDFLDALVAPSCSIAKVMGALPPTATRTRARPFSTRPVPPTSAGSSRCPTHGYTDSGAISPWLCGPESPRTRSST